MPNVTVGTDPWLLAGMSLAPRSGAAGNAAGVHNAERQMPDQDPNKRGDGNDIDEMGDNLDQSFPRKQGEEDDRQDQGQHGQQGGQSDSDRDRQGDQGRRQDQGDTGGRNM